MEGVVIVENLIKEFHARINKVAYCQSLKKLAAEMDMSSSELSRRLGNDTLPLRFNDCIKIMIITGDYSPLDIILDQGGFSRETLEKSPTELTENVIQAMHELPDKLLEAVKALTKEPK